MERRRRDGGRARYGAVAVYVLSRSCPVCLPHGLGGGYREGATAGLEGSGESADDSPRRASAIGSLSLSLLYQFKESNPVPRRLPLQNSVEELRRTRRESSALPVSTDDDPGLRWARRNEQTSACENVWKALRQVSLVAWCRFHMLHPVSASPPCFCHLS